MYQYKYGIMGVKALKAGGAVGLAAFIVALVPVLSELPFIWIPVIAGALRAVNNFLRHQLGFDFFRLIKKT